MPSTHEIPSHYTCIVPDHVFHEIATTTSADRNGLICKFGKWAAKNASRMWFGRTKEDLITRQWESHGRRLSVEDIVHGPLTKWLRRFAIDSPDQWPNLVKTAQSGKSIPYRKKEIDQHVIMCEHIADAWQRKYPGRALPALENQAKWIRGPELVRPIATELYSARWRPEWSDRFAKHPDSLAVVRWSRFVGWYCMRRIAGQTVKFENNFDDATYGLLASYTGHLGTNDRGLQEAARAIFPGIRIVDQSSLIEIPE